ncbi:unnamed protein product [Microthlaspi erraticum]|uniref:Arabidopsis retrotransposon Orf1 C-terminal domain-containing protein n=1 Tax=Microthlaspi erraticum TaxID=1685480 RepID=A0A6D2K8Q6_9BRAS|nr:unnamed protein product [Microthlaspi erraticum]
MQLAKFFSHRLESYKELTCEFLASLRYHEYDELQRVWATIAEGNYSSPRSKAALIRSPVLRYVHKALANTFFARKATGTINEGEVKLLTMGIKPIISRTSDGTRIRGDRAHSGNLIPLLDQLLSYSTTAYNTRHQKGRRLSVGGIITPILCAAGVQLNKKKATPAGWMDIKFCKTNLLIEHKELDGKYQFKFTHPLAGPSKLLLPNPELTTVLGGTNIDFRHPVYTLIGHEADLQEEEPELDRAEDRAEIQAEDRVQESADLGEPECYYFEEYEAPRMNPYVLAANKRIGLLQKFNKWQGKAIEKMEKSMDKMVSKIKSLERKVSGSSSKKKKGPMAPTFPRSRSLLTTQRRLSTQEPHRASSFEPREGEDNTQRRRKTSKASSSSTTGLDRVLTQLDRAEGRVDLEEPLFENPGFEYDQTQNQDFSQTNWTPYNSFQQAQLLQGQGATPTLKMKKKKRRSRKLDRVRQSQLHGALLMAVYHLQTTTFPVLWGALRYPMAKTKGGEAMKKKKDPYMLPPRKQIKLGSSSSNARAAIPTSPHSIDASQEHVESPRREEDWALVSFVGGQIQDQRDCKKAMEKVNIEPCVKMDTPTLELLKIRDDVTWYLRKLGLSKLFKIECSEHSMLTKEFLSTVALAFPNNNGDQPAGDELLFFKIGDANGRKPIPLDLHALQQIHFLNHIPSLRSGVVTFQPKEEDFYVPSSEKPSFPILTYPTLQRTVKAQRRHQERHVLTTGMAVNQALDRVSKLEKIVECQSRFISRLVDASWVCLQVLPTLSTCKCTATR